MPHSLVGRTVGFEPTGAGSNPAGVAEIRTRHYYRLQYTQYTPETSTRKGMLQCRGFFISASYQFY